MRKDTFDDVLAALDVGGIGDCLSMSKIDGLNYVIEHLSQRTFICYNNDESLEWTFRVIIKWASAGLAILETSE